LQPADDLAPSRLGLLLLANGKAADAILFGSVGDFECDKLRYASVMEFSPGAPSSSHRGETLFPERP
jgi:hypothetical protein